MTFSASSRAAASLERNRGLVMSRSKKWTGRGERSASLRAKVMAISLLPEPASPTKTKFFLPDRISKIRSMRRLLPWIFTSRS